jgi:hypothetical protein
VVSTLKSFFRKSDFRLNKLEVTTLEQARTLIEQPFQTIQLLTWQLNQFKQQLFGRSSERQTGEQLSKEQMLMSLFAAPASVLIS